MNKITWMGKDERGQALVLIGFVFIGLVAMLGLAVDGGQLYSQRREAQNAADGAAIAGGYKLRVQNQVSGGLMTDQEELLAAMNRAAEAHGVPDTDGIAGNQVNDNLTAYYTTSPGAVNDSCKIGSCSEIPRDAWGVQVHVRKPFKTYFAGVVGWDEAVVGAHAVAVVHAGAKGNDNKYWAIFGDDRHGCGGDAVNVSGSTTQIIGNAHSNMDFKMTGARAVTNGQVTYVRNCQHCRSDPDPEQNPDGVRLEYPSFDAYQTLAANEAPGFGQYFTGDLSLSNNQTLGSEAKPISYVKGDFDVTGDNVVLTGLIFVEGNVRLKGKNISGNVTIVTTGEIKIDGSSKDMNLRPYAGDPARYPILDPEVNVALFYTNGSGSNLCNTPIIDITGSQNIFTGAIMAPNGRIRFAGATNWINGAVIADSIEIGGSSNRVSYNGSYFPPQPDRIELLE